jgi:hypothetical protein
VGEALQKLSGVRFLVKAPDEQPIGPRGTGWVEKFLEKLGGHGRLARPAETHQGQDTPKASPPVAAQLGQLNFPPDKIRGRW